MIQELNQIVTVQTYVSAQLKKIDLLEQTTNCLQERWWQKSVYAFYVHEPVENYKVMKSNKLDLSLYCTKALNARWITDKAYPQTMINPKAFIFLNLMRFCKPLEELKFWIQVSKH